MEKGICQLSKGRKARGIENHHSNQKISTFNQERALLRAQIRALEAATNAGTNEISITCRIYVTHWMERLDCKERMRRKLKRKCNSRVRKGLSQVRLGQD